MPLHSVPPAPPPEKPKRKSATAPKPASMLECRRCNGREVIETKTGVLYQNGKTKGGTKALICAACHRKGERVLLA